MPIQLKKQVASRTFVILHGNQTLDSVSFIEYFATTY